MLPFILGYLTALTLYCVYNAVQHVYSKQRQRECIERLNKQYSEILSSPHMDDNEYWK